MRKMEEPTKRKVGRPKKSTTAAAAAAKLEAAIEKSKASLPDELKSVLVGVGVAGKDAEKLKPSAKTKPVIAADDVKIDKTTASKLLKVLSENLKEVKKSASADAPDKFPVKGLVWSPGDGCKVRTLFVGDQVYAEFPMTEDGSVTAFYPYTTWNSDLKSSAVTFPADWLVAANAEQLAQMGCGATTITAVDEDDEDEVCDGCCCCSEDGEDDEESITLSELAEMAIKELGITEADIVALLKAQQ